VMARTFIGLSHMTKLKQRNVYNTRKTRNDKGRHKMNNDE